MKRNSTKVIEPSKRTTFVCPLDLLERAKLAAKKDRRTLSGYLIKLIDDATKPTE